jgi:hypothetical protein
VTEQATSVLQIEVDDSQFKSYTADFYKYKNAVSTLPGDWGKVAKQTGDGQSHFVATVASLKAIEESTKNINKANAAGSQKMDGTLLSFGKLRRYTQGIATDMANVTFNLLKWTALGGVLSLAGGFFGMDKLAGSAVATRRQSMGLGVTPGELKAAQVNYSPYMDVNSTLGNIADAKSDLSKRWAFSALGVSGDSLKNKDAAELLPEMIPKLVAAFKRTGQTTQGADALGLTNFVDVDTLRRLSKLSPQELQQTASQYGQDKDRLGLSDATLKKWTELDKQLDRSKTTIETVLIDKLSNLSVPLGHLSDSFTKAVSQILSDPRLPGFIDSLAAGIEKFANYLQTPEFKKDLDTFVTGVGELAASIVKGLQLLHVIDTPDNRTPEQQTADEGNSNKESNIDPGMQTAKGSSVVPTISSQTNQFTKENLGGKAFADRQNQVVNSLMGMGWTKAQASGIAANINKESAYDPTAHGDKGLAYGLGQWHPDRQANFKKWAGFDIHDKRADLQKQLEFYTWELHQPGYEKALAGLQQNPDDAGAGAAAVSRYGERPKYADLEAQTRAANANNIAQHVTVIKVENNTGGSAVASASSLAPAAS